MKFDYVYKPNWYSKTDLKNLWETIDNSEKIFEPKIFGTTYKKLQTNVIQLKSFLDTANKFLNFGWNANEECFCFDLFSRGPQFLNLNYYVDGSSYDWHRDWARTESSNSIKLTVIMNISREKYEGGNLELFLSNQPKIIEEFQHPGTIIAFPSFVLHRVTEVKNGERISLSSWFTGPKWR